MSEIGALQVRIGLNQTDFATGIKQAAGRLTELETASGRLGAGLKRFAGNLAEVGRKAATIFSGMAVAGAGAMAAIVKSSLSAIDEQSKLATRVGASIDGLRGLQIAAQDAGLPLASVGDILEKMNSRLAEAERGSGTARKALEILGLTTRDFVGLDADQRVALLADRIKELGLSSGQAADVLRQFGVRNQEMVNLLIGGGDAIRAARAEVDAFGLSVNQVDAARIERFNDSVSRLSFFTEGAATQFTVGLSPALEATVELLKEMSGETRTWADLSRQAGEAVADSIVEVLRVYEQANLASARFLLFFLDMQASAARFGAAIREHFGGAMNDVQRDVIDAAVAQRAFVEELEATIRLSDRFAAHLENSRNRPLELTIGGGVSRGGGEDPAIAKAQERADREAEIAREALARRLEAVRAFLRNEEEAERFAHAGRLEDLGEALAAKLLTEEEHFAMRELLTEEHLARLQAMRDAQAEAERKLAEEQDRHAREMQEAETQRLIDRAQAFSGFFGNMATAAAAGGKKMFALAKALNVAQATMDGVAAAVGAYKVGASIGGPPLGAAFAAAATAATGAMIAQIMSAELGAAAKGTKATNTGGGGLAATTTAQQQAPQIIRLEGVAPGQQYTGEQIIGLVNAAQRRGAVLEIAR